MSRGGWPGSLREALRRRGLATPVALLAEMHRPLAPLLSDLATLASPLAEPLLGRGRVGRLTSQEGLDALLMELGTDPSTDRSDDEQPPT